MSENRSAHEIARHMSGRFDGGNSAEGKRHQATRDGRIREVAAENKHRSKRNTGAYATDTTGDLGDMGENDSLGG